jgi:rhodanese-related sulfurtransferase
MASHEAARRAVKAGYTDVSVMVDGIMGWKDAGQPTATGNVSKNRNS